MRHEAKHNAVDAEPIASVPQKTFPKKDSHRLLIAGTLILGLLSFATVLLFHNLADGDLWAKLALGAAVWKDGKLPMHDVFAFTPTLPVYVDHEWGSGLVFFTFLKFFGPGSLMFLKVLLAFIAIGAALLVGRRFESNSATLLALSVPCAFCILFGYVPVIRSHAFTYACFAITLLLLELIRAGRRWPAFALVLLMMLWTNLHGGFVAGLCTIGLYAVTSLVERKNAKVMVVAAIGCFAATLINPYGPKYWTYLLPAVLHKRSDIGEWQPMAIWANDVFGGFRVLFVLTVCALIFGRRAMNKSWPGLCMVVITAVLALRSRRHAPFFGVTVLAFAGPYFSCAIRQAVRKLAATPIARLGAERVVFGGFVALALFISVRYLPGASVRVLAPVSQFPVREADILARSGLSGNFAVPFEWGSYASWRLFPKVKVSIDGRYEAAYPESSYEMSRDFFAKHGANWDRLLTRHVVDFIAIDLQHSRLRPEDLAAKGYVTVWRQEGISALVVQEKHAATLSKVVADLPPQTIEALNPAIPLAWPRY